MRLQPKHVAFAAASCFAPCRPRARQGGPSSPALLVPLPPPLAVVPPPLSPPTATRASRSSRSTRSTPPPRRRRRRRRHPDDDDANGDGVDYDDFEEGDGDEIDAASRGDTPLSLCADALPGTQVARLRSLQAEAEARRDTHFTMYRAHSWKANLLSAIVLVCTTAGGTSGLISLTANSGVGPPLGGGATGFSGIPMGAGGSGGGSNAAALLSPILGYAATLFSGWQQYAKTSTTASRHLTAAKRYQVIARHVRDALAYGAVGNYARVIQAVERKNDQYEDESPVVNISPDAPLPGPGAAFLAALFELPE